MNAFWLFNALDAWTRLSEGLLRLNLSAGEVIARRTTMLMTGALSPAEAATMLLEKPGAVMASAERAIAATLRGADAATVAHAALTPYKVRAAANARRLRP